MLPFHVIVWGDFIEKWLTTFLLRLAVSFQLGAR